MSEVEGSESDILDELHDLFKKGTGGFGEYVRHMQNLGHIPGNQFDHAWGLIHQQKKDQEKKSFNFLEDQNKYLGNVSDDKVLRFYQLDHFFLTNIFSLGQVDPAEELVFEVLWANFVSELRMTCNVEGVERHLQAFLHPISGRTGFGFGKKKKRKAVEYITPQEEPQQEGNY